jgi:hypothetical protein
MGMENLVTNFLTVYFVTREFGGHEEGGWYYDRRVKHFSLYVGGMSDDRFEALESEVEAWVDFINEGKRHLSSVLSSGEYQLYREEVEGEFESTERPMYE